MRILLASQDPWEHRERPPAGETIYPARCLLLRHSFPTLRLIPAALPLNWRDDLLCFAQDLYPTHSFSKRGPGCPQQHRLGVSQERPCPRCHWVQCRLSKLGSSEVRLMRVV